MTDKEMKMKMVKHLTRLLIEENVTDINNHDSIWCTVESYKALGVFFSPFRYHDSNDWACVDEIDMNTGEVLNTYPVEPTKRDLVEIVLQRQVTRKQLESLKRDWKAFYNDPLKYKNLAEMVNDYLNKIEIDKSMMDDIKQGFEICK